MSKKPRRRDVTVRPTSQPPPPSVIAKTDGPLTWFKKYGAASSALIAFLGSIVSILAVQQTVTVAPSVNIELTRIFGASFVMENKAFLAICRGLQRTA